MKVRTAHVSNSSTSSFIIGLKKIPKFDAKTVERYPILNHIEKLIKDLLGNQKSFKTVEEYDAWFLKDYGWNDQTIKNLIKEDEYLETVYNKGIEAIKNGFEVMDISVDQGDYGRCTLMSNLPDGENIIMIRGD